MKSGYIYIMTSHKYHLNNIFKIGRTTNLNMRLCDFNTARINTDSFYILYFKECQDYIACEKEIHHKLTNFKMCKEFFKGDLQKFKKCITSTIRKNSIVYDRSSHHTTSFHNMVSVNRISKKRTSIARKCKN